MRMSDWSSDVCSADLGIVSSGTAVDRARQIAETYAPGKVVNMMAVGSSQQVLLEVRFSEMLRSAAKQIGVSSAFSSDSGKFLGSTGSSVSLLADESGNPVIRSEEHTSELQSLMRISYAVFCLKKKK